MNKQDDYKTKAKARLKEWQAKIDELEMNAKEGRQEVSRDIRAELDKLAQKRQAVQNKIASFTAAALETRDDVKTSIDQGLNELGKAVDSAYKKVKKSLSNE